MFDVKSHLCLVITTSRKVSMPECLSACVWGVETPKQVTSKTMGSFYGSFLNTIMEYNVINKDSFNIS